jgi:FAD dependent oxidoreductase/Pyridine nucleotide-disulphide oxidoreductase
MNKLRLALCVTFLFLIKPVFGQQVLLETEGFSDHGGWVLDTQFITKMGSPYLLAHGLGKPVADATTEVKFPKTGQYHVYVRTKDWVARWQATGQPGRFEIHVDGKPLSKTFGTEGADWFWQDGGTVNIENATAKISLHDLTGFDGRCDAILFSKESTPPPNTSDILPAWRRQLLGLSEKPADKSGYDLVVVGGGYAGMGAAISAARTGCKVALIQDRPVLGGNGSSEVRVWAMGLIRRGKYPRIGEIIEEFCDHATKSPGTYEEFGDAQKEAIVRAEANIDLFLNHHAFKVDMDRGQIAAVHAFDTKSGQQTRFAGRYFVDCTGHGTIGFLANADYEMEEKGRMGMSNMWAWAEADMPVSFPETPWALDLTMEDFPYPRDFHGQWFWESGYDKDPLGDAEGIRDWNFRAVYGAFNAMKNRDGAEDHKNAMLTWMAYIGGPRESRRLMGDIVLTQDDIVEKREFKDGCVPSTWSIDLHYPKEQYAAKFPDNPFISIAVHDRRIDRDYGYPVPYRCFYSRNVNNLFMTGRNISVTHEALGTTRVMKTCGMMGEVVGKAASVCVLHNCLPRDVYENYWDEMDELLKLPGKAYRKKVGDEFTIPDDALPSATSKGVIPNDLAKLLPGVVIDNLEAESTGDWTHGGGLKGFLGADYQYASPNSDASIRFKSKAPKAGRYQIRIAYQPHENRGKRVPVTVATDSKTTQYRVDMTVPPQNPAATTTPQTRASLAAQQFYTLGEFTLVKDENITVMLTTEDAGGLVHADAVQIVAVSSDSPN